MSKECKPRKSVLAERDAARHYLADLLAGSAPASKDVTCMHCGNNNATLLKQMKIVALAAFAAGARWAEDPK